MRKRLIGLFIIALAMTACKPDPEPNVDPNGGGTSDTTETVVKKYLVKEYHSNPDQPEKIIEWDEEYKRILRIVTKPGNSMYEVAYNFKYYGADSLRVDIALPEHTAFWYVGFSSFTAYLNEGKITHINYYIYDSYLYTEDYSYDDQGRLVSILNNGEHPHGVYYKWEGENVCESWNMPPSGGTQEYGDFCEHIHPEYTMPFVLSNGYTAQYGNGYIIRPLWKNWRKWDGVCKHEVDDDGYVTLSYYVNSEGDTLPHTHYVYSN